MSDDDPGLMVTQKLEPPKAVELPPSDADDSAAEKIDQSFIDELENSMSQEISPDQLKA